MEISDIIGSILAILTFVGVIVALGLGLHSFRENRKLLSRQFKNKLLDDVLSWALEFAECGHGLVLELQRDFKNPPENLADIARAEGIAMGNLYLAYLRIYYRGKYIKEISPLLGGELKNLIDEVMKQLVKEIEGCKKYKDRFLEVKGDMKKHEEVRNGWVKEGEEARNSIADAVYGLIRGISEVAREYSS